MAKVPTFEGGQRRAPLHQGNFTVRATPEAFGAATGRGLMALGQGVGNLGEAVSTVADLRAQNALKTAQADYMEGARALISDPETGFLSRTGSDAINGLTAVEAQLEDLGRGIAERLPGQVRPKFQDFRIGHNTNLGREMLRHKAQQTKAETRSASDRRIAVLKQEAVRNHADPIAHLNSLTEAENEFRAIAGLEGLSEEATEQKLAEYRDGVQSDIILQMAEADPLAAETYFENVKDGLQEETRQGIERILSPSLEIARADQKAEEIFSGINTAGSGNIVQDTADFLVDSVANNALSLAGDENNDTLTGSAGNDTLSAPDPERIERVEQVRQPVRQRGEVNAIRLARAGVMLSPGNLLFSTILGAPLAIAVTRAEPDAPLASLLADTLGVPSDAPLRTDLESELGEATAGDLRNEFSKGAAQHFGGVDVEASLVAIENPQERLLATDQVSTRFAAGHTEQQVAADQRIKAAFSEIAKGNGLSGLSLDAKAALQGRLKSAAVKLEKKRAAGGEPKTDFPLAHTLARQFAEDPDGFAGINIYELRPEFGQAAFGLLESWHGLARKGSDEADERAAEIAALFEQGTRHITDAGLNPDSRDKDIQPRISRFLFRFVAEASDFHEANGALPGDEDLKQIARQLRPLLPEVEGSHAENSEVWRLAYEQALEDFAGDEEKAAQHADDTIARLSNALKETAGTSERSLAISDAVRSEVGDRTLTNERRAERGGFSLPSDVIASAAEKAGFAASPSGGEDGVQFASLYGSGTGPYGRYRGDGRVIEFPDGSRGPGGNFWDLQFTTPDDDEQIRQFLLAVANFALDFVPIVGDAKAFDEAEDGIDYAIAIIGLLPGAGDLTAKVLKTARTASRVRRVGWRRPSNFDFANEIYPLEKLTKELRAKYPHSVPFNGAGFPDFSRYSIKNVRIELGKSREVDFSRADKAAGYGPGNPRPEDYTWHHHEDVGYMQLIPTDIHDAVKHTGGIAVNKQADR